MKKVFIFISYLFLSNLLKSIFTIICINSERYRSYNNLFFYLVENLDCVKVDFYKQNFEQQTFSDTISSLTEEFLYDVSTIKPEVILADHIQESQYLMHTRGALRSLGYTGHFSSLQDGRGLGVFVRKDIADNLPIAPGTVYQSYLDTS